MALTIDAIASAAATTGASTTLITTITNSNLTVGAGATCLLALLTINEQNNTTPPASVTVNWDNAGTPQAMTLLGSQEDGLGNCLVLAFGLLNPTAGNKQLTATWTGANVGVALDAMSFAGGFTTTIAAAFPHVATAQASTGSTAPAVSVTSAVGNYTAAASLQINAQSSLTATSSTSLFNFTDAPNAFGHLGSYAPGAASVSWAGATTAGEWSIIAVDVAAAPSSATPANPIWHPRIRQKPGKGPIPLIPQPWRGDFVTPGPAPPANVWTIPRRSPELAPFRRGPGRGPRALVPIPWAYYTPDPIQPGTGSVVFTGLAPSVDQSLLPGAGSIAFTGNAPAVNESLLPGAGSVVFTGLAPSADESLLPGAGSIAFAGLAPSVSESLLPDAGSVLFTGLAPSVSNGGSSSINLLPGTGSIAFTGLAPAIDEAVFPATGFVTFTGFAPIMPILPGVGSIAFTGFAPSVLAQPPRRIVAQPQFLW